MSFLQAIKSDLSVLIVCNKTGGTIKGDIKNILSVLNMTTMHLKQHRVYTQGSLAVSDTKRRY